MFIVGTILLYKGGFEFSKSPLPPKKIRGSDFTHKRGGLVKKGGCFKKRGTLLLISIITSTFESYFSLIMCWCLLSMLTPYLSEFFVSFEKINLIGSNQLICDFYKSVIFEQPRHVELCKVNLWLFIECNRQLLWAQNRWC